MQIKENIKLAPYTTFKIGGEARYFCEVKDQFDALTAFEFAQKHNLPVFILGGGSNLLISDNGFKGLVVKIINRGIEVVSEDGVSVNLKVASGEIWDQVVDFAVKNNWWGIENLSHIPGSSGAIAVQNVGAYGQEAKNVIESVTVFNTQTHQILSLAAKECGFAYRQSIFNSSQRGRYIIFEIVFKLSKIAAPNLSYRDLQMRFTGNGHKLADIRQAVIEIRDKKFPFPTQAVLGNAGSFFKNLILDQQEYLALKKTISQKFSEVFANQLDQKKFNDGGNLKVPTAYLMEICGLKDISKGGACINSTQPLVIVNKSGNATAQDVLALAKEVKKLLNDQLNVNIHIEPELVGFSQQELNGIL